MTTDERFPLDQLADLAEVSERQVRELVRLRLLPAPSSGGRGATYGSEHLDRLRAWKALKQKAPTSTTNDQLRILLDKLSDAGLLRPIADGKVPFDLVDDQKTDVAIGGFEAATFEPMLLRESEPAFAAAPPTQRVNEEALTYLSSLRRGGRDRVVLRSATSAPRLELGVGSAGRSGAQLPLERLRAALEEYVAQHAAVMRVKPLKTETWQRVAIGRDLEISARGPLQAEDVQLLETVGQLLQQAIYPKGR